MSAMEVVADLRSSTSAGLDHAEADRRLANDGPNALLTHGVTWSDVLLRQIRNPLLGLLMAAAAISTATGGRADTGIILVIVLLSIGLGFVNEYRSEQAVAALHNAIRHSALVTRQGASKRVDVVDLVRGDIVHIGVGDVVPADLRLIDSQDLECDESVLTGESLPAEKTTTIGSTSCALMGSVVRSGSGRGVVVATAKDTTFGKIANRLGESAPPTAFQIGLAEFSSLLVKVAFALCVAIFVINAVFKQSLLEALLFSLAIAIGITPQLLPAIVTVSLSTGARRLARQRVVVKRLVTIEDLGNIEVLFTDKTGTLTEGKVSYLAGLDADSQPCPDLLALGLLCSEVVVEGEKVVGGNALDVAVWDAALLESLTTEGNQRLAAVPFDHERRVSSVLIRRSDALRMITKGAPESVLSRCVDVPEGATSTLQSLYAHGARVIAIATREMHEARDIHAADEVQLTFEGFLTFADPPKTDAGIALERLARLGICVKVITGDSGVVAEKVCDELGLAAGKTISGDELSVMTNKELRGVIAHTRVFARVSPEQKSRVIMAQRSTDVDVAFLGDGVNDAIALHDADVGISVQGASEVARDAADIVLLEKDLGVLADGVVEGRQIFANTMKYVLMATSSNFGNMFSAAGASVFLSFLPMLPGQILLNNLLYDMSQIAIPTDNVDEEQLKRPSAWDIGFIRRFMATFGPISSIFDFATFGIMIWVLRVGHDEFRSAWFMESLCTQTLVIFVIRTRRIPFWKSRPGTPMLISTLTCAGIAIALPFSPISSLLGFHSLPLEWLGILGLLVVIYLVLCEIGKALFYRMTNRDSRNNQPVTVSRKRPNFEHKVHSRAFRFSVARPRRRETAG